MTRVNTGGARARSRDDLVGRFPPFASEERVLSCTDLAATVAEIAPGSRSPTARASRRR